ncbi:MAG: hypothetical protein H6581_12065 [Bacteroidia bacterium]|nr:hypothetical protein [Bacteroidia bacterium]
MSQLSHTKLDDLKGLAQPGQKVDLKPFLGTWKNTKPGSGQIPKIIMRETEGELYMHAWGACTPQLCDWGQARCEVFTDGPGSPLANAFLARFTFEQMDVEISSNVKLGVLVVQTYTRFKDGSARHNYYTREFYGPEI